MAKNRYGDIVLTTMVKIFKENINRYYEVLKRYKMLKLFETDMINLISIEHIDLTPEQKAAFNVFKRSERFVEGYLCREHLIKLCNQFFGDKNTNEDNGLVHQFKEMRNTVLEKGFIGLILTGINETDILIQTYITENFKKIRLTVGSICRTLLRQHFTEKEVEDLCRSTPNFSIYYS